MAAAGVVEYAIEQAAGQIAKHARISRRVADIIASTDQEKDRAAALRIGCLVLFNALAFQDRLATANEDAPTVNESLGTGIPGLSHSWRDICENIDYVPVFELAANILDVLRDGTEDVQAPVTDPLVKAMEDTRRLEGHDLSGGLFHILLTDAKFTGAYYTSVPAATLLSRLVFQDWPLHVDWADHEFPAALNVADTDQLLESSRQAQGELGEESAERQRIVAAAELLGQLLLQDVARTAPSGLRDGSTITPLVIRLQPAYIDLHAFHRGLQDAYFSLQSIHSGLQFGYIGPQIVISLGLQVAYGGP